MFKLVLSVCFMLYSFKSWSWSVREVWPKATREQKLFLMEEYRIFFSKNPEALADWEEKKSTFIQIIHRAYADELTCVFGGWPSKKVGDSCSPPSTHNPAYQAGNCGADKMQCQPLFFGAGLCVPVSTQKERGLAFGSCQKAFTNTGKNYADILDEVEAAGKQVELLALLEFADKACQTGFQAPQLLCRRLEAVVTGLKSAMDAKEEVEPVKKEEKDPTTPKAVADATLVNVTKLAVNLNTTVKDVSQAPTNCPPEVSNETATVQPKVTGELGIYGPVQALADINSGELAFVGRDLFPNYEERSCVYKSPTAFVIYHNCTADRREASATNIEVISYSGQAMRFFVENSQPKPEISNLKRSEYDNTWSISLKRSIPISSQASLAEIKNYNSKLEADFSGACWIGDSGGAKGSGSGNCHGTLSSIQSSWAQSSESFWREPGESWIATKKLLRQKVRTSPF